MGQPTARTKARRRERRAQIIEAAHRLTEAEGGFTADTLAAAADVSRASIFYYFEGGREEIDVALALREYWAWLDELPTVVRGATTGGEALGRILRRAAARWRDDPDGTFGVLQRMSASAWPEELLEEHIERQNAAFGVAEPFLQADREAGRLSPEIEDIRRYIMLCYCLPVGPFFQDQSIRNTGGSSLHATADMLEDLARLVERGTQS